MMNENPIFCDDAALEDMLRPGQVREPSSEWIAHLEHCVYCQRRIGELAGPAAMWHDVKAAISGPSGANPAGTFTFPTQDPAAIPWTEALAVQLLSPPTHPEMLGRLGRYDVERLIGSGGMGVVLKAFDTELNRPVAIKLLAPFLANSGSARKRFSREARAAAAVVHRHVVPIHNVETDRAVPFIVMQFVSGESLQARIDRDGSLELCEILRIGMQVADGLSAAHEQGLVHRDIKPSNILLEEDVDRALLSDFGLARAADDASLTRTGFHPGTPQFMSPEQASGQIVDPRSDLFSLGSTLYTMCTGRPPFQAESSLSVMRRITDSEPAPIRSINPRIPDWLSGIVMLLMRKNQAERLQSARQVHELLKSCLSHVQNPQANPVPTIPLHAVPPHTVPRIQRALRIPLKGRLAMEFLVVGILCLLIGPWVPSALQMLAMQNPPERSSQPLSDESRSQESGPPAEGSVAESPTDAEIALFEVTVNGKAGFINKVGAIVIEPKYDAVIPFCEGLAAFRSDDRWGFINGRGAVVIEPRFAQVGSFSGGYAPVRIQNITDRWGFIDTEGKVVIEPQFDHAEAFRNGIAKVGMVVLRGVLLSMIADVGTELDYHYIDVEGNRVPKPTPQHYATGEPGELIAFQRGKLFGYVNAEGHVMIEPQFLAAQDFSDGLACVCKDRLLGYIDTSGEFVIPPSFQYANAFSDGLAGVQLEEGKWGFINKSGRIVIPPMYNWVYGGFREGLAQVTVAGRVGYINKIGGWVW